MTDFIEQSQKSIDMGKQAAKSIQALQDFFDVADEIWSGIVTGSLTTVEKQMLSDARAKVKELQ